ncbi:MAG: discoidin domain-containing protein, partial [Oscillospiraceae bacterium]|nr:discoidin domain-containing protein [Oscillospiraceae bacterium]
RENAGLLLLAAASVDAGISPDEPLSGNPQAAEFLWRMLRYVEPYGRFEQTPDGYWLDAFDLEDICREALDCPPGEDPPEGSAFVARDDGYEWQESFCEDWFIDIYTWEPQPDGSVRVCFNVLYDGILFLSFLRQGEAVLLPNEAPVYYHYRLSSLFWNESPKFTPSRVEASSTRPGEDQVSFSPFNLFDNNTATAWAAGIGGEADVEGDVAPPWLLMAFRTPRYVTGFVIVNGWRRDLQSMRMNDRVRLLQIECGALSMEVELEDISDYRIGGDDQSFCFGEAILTEKVTFTVISTYNGIAEDSSVCISEIAFF